MSCKTQRPCSELNSVPLPMFVHPAPQTMASFGNGIFADAIGSLTNDI